MSHRPQQRQQVPTAQAKRYRAGVPKGYVEESSDSDEEEEAPQQQQQQQQKPTVQFAQKDVETGIQQVTISDKDAATDRRLLRLQQAQQAKQQQQGTGSGLRRRVQEEEESSDEDGSDKDEEQQAQDRLRMKQKALERAQVEQQPLGSIGLDDEDSNEDSEVSGNVGCSFAYLTMLILGI
jgi:microfibrillar-associated protein 1